VSPSNWRTPIGIAATLLWLTTTLYWTFHQPHHTWQVPQMRPNEWADWAAGAFAPLAFLWLVLGYLQQGDELQQNTAALRQQEAQLRAQTDELQKSSVAHRELVEATRLQAESSALASRVASAATVSAFQPAFFVRKTDGNPAAGSARVQLSNSGKEAIDVRLVLSNREPGATVRPEQVEAWPTNKDILVALTFPPGSSQLESHLGILYLDQLGFRQVKEFKVTVQGAPANPSLKVTPRPGLVNVLMDTND
jgi:hypothetical protein